MNLVLILVIMFACMGIGYFFLVQAWGFGTIEAQGWDHLVTQDFPQEITKFINKV